MVADVEVGHQPSPNPPLSSVLDQLLKQSRRLVGGMAGSVSLVDTDRGRYAKLAEYGASCQLGRTFPLAEGITGQVMARRRPVVLASYREVTVGHLPSAHPASRGAVTAVPIWWRGEVIGANVVFGGPRGGFTGDEVDELELLTQEMAPSIVRASRAVQTRSAPAEPVASAVGSGLTGRELEVLSLLALGMSDREVASALVISPKTAEKHVGAILRKTSTTRRTAAVMRSLERGWLDPSHGAGRP
jgi:DNA-binding CsgD family transcriptional regulator